MHVGRDGDGCDIDVMKASVTPRKCETSTQPDSIAVNMVNAVGGNSVASSNHEAGCYASSKVTVGTICAAARAMALAAACGGAGGTPAPRVPFGEVAFSSPIDSVHSTSLLPTCSER